MQDDSAGIGRRVGGAVGGAIGGALDRAVGTVGQAGRLLTGVISLPGLSSRLRTSLVPAPGTAAGIEVMADAKHPPPRGTVRIHCVDYGPEKAERQEVSLARLTELARPSWACVRWLRVEGLHPYVINELRKVYKFHTLSAEDVLHVPQRARAEVHEDHLFVISHLFRLHDGALSSQQVSMFLFEDLLVTFQERPDATWEPILERIDNPASRTRQRDAGYLAYGLLDTIIDHGFPILEHYAERLEHLEDVIMERQGPELLQRVHGIRRELSVLGRILRPMRDMSVTLSRDDLTLIHGDTSRFMNDVRDHCVQLLDMVETFRDVAAGLTDLALSMSSYRVNEVMRVLTVISTIFIPITFVAGVYGMNFHRIPELEWRNGYLAFWAFCAVCTGALLWFFRRRGWFNWR